MNVSIQTEYGFFVFISTTIFPEQAHPFSMREHAQTKNSCDCQEYSRGEQLTLLREDLTAQEQELLANLVRQDK